MDKIDVLIFIVAPIIVLILGGSIALLVIQHNHYEYRTETTVEEMTVEDMHTEEHSGVDHVYINGYPSPIPYTSTSYIIAANGVEFSIDKDVYNSLKVGDKVYVTRTTKYKNSDNSVIKNKVKIGDKEGRIRVND